MAGNMSIGGLISGIDTNSMLDQLYQAAQTPILRLQSKKETLSQQSVAWSQLEAKLLSFQTWATRLAAPAGFQVFQTAVSKPELATVSAGTNAITGSYSFTVKALAQTHQLTSQGYADLDQTEVGSGTITITVGEDDPVVVEVANYTLSELRDAINSADAGINATIVNDGSGPTPYRLVLTSGASGLAGEMNIVMDLNGGATPVLSELQTAQEAEIELGSGAGAITVKSSTNTFSNVIQGVTINALEAAPTTPITLTVSRDTTALREMIEDFVASYNELIDFFSEQFSFDEETSATGTLFGNYRLQSLQQDLSAALSNRVVGLSGELSSLSGLGIRADATGKLTIDNATLTLALTNELPEVISLFAATGQTSNAAISYLASSSETRASGINGWEVEITQVATRSRVTAGVAQTAPLATAETLTINNVSIELTAGMTQSEIITAINAQQAQTGVTASATGADGQGVGNYLTLTRATYGSAFHITAESTLSNQSGPGTSGLGTTTITDSAPQGESGTGTGSVGQEVEGTIGGFACTGSGQRLTASEGEAKGLTLLITADTAGSYGKVYFTVGMAEAVFRETLAATDSVNGTVARERNYLNETTSDLDAEIARIQKLVEAEQERLKASFIAMESALAEFQSQSQFLASQFAQIQANAKKN